MKPKDLFITLVIAITWVMVYSFNTLVFKFSAMTSWISLIFIPSGLKLAYATIYRWRSIPGLFLGSMATGLIFLNDFTYTDIAMFSFFSATLPYLTFIMIAHFLPLSSSLSNLSVKHIVSFATLFSILNAGIHLSYRHHILFLKDPYMGMEFVGMAVGDFSGIFLFMWVIARFMKYIRSHFHK